jgi:hypothetical protein
MRTVGDGLQAQTWESLVEAMIRESGGAALSGVQSHVEDLDEDQAERVEEWLKALISERKRAQHAAAAGSPRREQGKAATTGRTAGAEATI